MKTKVIKYIAIGVLGIILLLGGYVFLIHKTCDMTYLTEKIFSKDGNYYVQVQRSECSLLNRYTIDVVITTARHSLIEKLIGSSTEDILILKGHNPKVVPTWIDNRILKIQYQSCSGIYGRVESWKDIKILHEGKCIQN